MTVFGAVMLCVSAALLIKFTLFVYSSMAERRSQTDAQALNDGIRMLGTQFASASMYGLIATLVASGTTSIHWTLSVSGVIMSVLGFQIGVYLIHIGSTRRNGNAG